MSVLSKFQFMIEVTSSFSAKPSYRNVARFENESFTCIGEIEMQNLTERETGNPFI